VEPFVWEMNKYFKKETPQKLWFLLEDQKIVAPAPTVFNDTYTVSNRLFRSIPDRRISGFFLN